MVHPALGTTASTRAAAIAAAASLSCAANVSFAQSDPLKPRNEAAPYAAHSLWVAQPLAPSEDRAQPERGERRSSTAAQERQICKEIRLVDRGHPGKGDAVYETATVECPANRSEDLDARQVKLCGQTILVKRGYPGQGEEVLERTAVRCPMDQAAPASPMRRTAPARTLCEAQSLVRRSHPGQGEDVFKTVLVDCPMEHA